MDSGEQYCDDGFSSTDAQTTCKQLGYNSTITMTLVCKFKKQYLFRQ